MTEDELVEAVARAIWLATEEEYFRPYALQLSAPGSQWRWQDAQPGEQEHCRLCARAALATLRELECVWTEEPDAEYWATACGNAFTVIGDTPSKNGMRFCPYCGLRLVEHTEPEESHADA